MGEVNYSLFYCYSCIRGILCCLFAEFRDHPELEREDVLASLNFAKLYLSGHSIKEVA